ncbi:hypothetical protein [Cerasicoccus fimbriatus]|uniref:hypothetical protein n=1 Tax=Cerasicoccus fimbriatus TaxID=3014554 RepID=UPI0022B3EADB|nr:hypothetical protein [Cerasicoccus sp. TK19100]
MATLLDKLDKRFGRFAIKNLTFWIMIGQIAVFGFGLLTTFPVENLMLYPDLVLKGQIWRVFTFIWESPAISPIWLIFYFWLFYIFGSALEEHWGEFRFNIFILIGMVCTVVASLMNWALLPADIKPLYAATNWYLMSSVTFAFAIVYPNFELRLYFVLPVKIKWIALFTIVVWVFTARSIFDWTLMLASLVNVTLFFGRSFFQGAKARNRRVAHQREQKKIESEAFHTCIICGKTDKSDPDMEFAYLDGEGYCEDHWAEMDKRQAAKESN